MANIVDISYPGQQNRERDYLRKRAQYAAVGIPEYVIVDPQTKIVTVLVIERDSYRELGCYAGTQQIVSPTFLALALTADQLFAHVPS